MQGQSTESSSRAARREHAFGAMAHSRGLSPNGEFRGSVYIPSSTVSWIKRKFWSVEKQEEYAAMKDAERRHREFYGRTIRDAQRCVHGYESQEDMQYLRERQDAAFEEYYRRCIDLGLAEVIMNDPNDHAVGWKEYCEAS